MLLNERSHIVYPRSLYVKNKSSNEEGRVLELVYVDNVAVRALVIYDGQEDYKSEEVSDVDFINQ